MVHRRCDTVDPLRWEACRQILSDRDVFIRMLLTLYERNMAISQETIRQLDWDRDWDLELWLSIMESENVLNGVPGRPGQYSLFRTHHTVNLVADARRERPGSLR